MGRRALTLLLVISVWSICLVPPASAANGSLVIAALQTLKREYIDPVKPIPLLNAALAALRKVTELGEDVLPDIPSDTAEAAAIYRFNDGFKKAVQTGKRPETDLAYLATKGMLSSLNDSHVSFMTPAELKEYESRMEGKPGFSGIGVIIRSMKSEDGGGGLFIEEVISGSPAAKAGLQKFDKIVEADGKALQGMTSRQASELIRGPTGSTVSLNIRRKDQTLSVSIVRSPIQFPAVVSEFIRPGVAYARLFSFSKGSGEQLRSALQSLAAKDPIKSAILDLRGNSGGWRTEEGIVAGAFLPPDTLLARVIGRAHPPQETLARGTPIIPTAPLVVLIDGGTASAGEVVALGLRFNHRATLVGDKSAGALGGTHTFKLSEGGMNITVEWVVGPKYEQVERVGITPDVLVPFKASDMEKGEDVQIEAALKVVGSGGGIAVWLAA